MREILEQKYKLLRNICRIELSQSYEDINSVIRCALVDFIKKCDNPAIWCYGKHTKMLMTDFIFELKRIRYIIDNGLDGREDSGFEIINESEIIEKQIDGVIISSRVHRDEIVSNLKSNYVHIPYLDIYDELEKAGIVLNVGYYAAGHPYSKYLDLNKMQRALLQENNKERGYALLRKIIKKYIEIKDFKSAIYYTDKLIELRNDAWERDLIGELHEVYELQEQGLKSINENNVLMLCIDGLRRKEICGEYMGNLLRFMKKEFYYFNNAYSISTSTFESLIPAYSENTDLRTKYYEKDVIARGRCRFIEEAKRQGRNIFFYTDGYRFIEDDAIRVKRQSQTATEKLWDFLLDAVDEKTGLFYIHILYESHYSYPNPYTTDEIVASGTNIMFDYLESNGGRIRTDYDRQQKDSLKYLDDVFFPLIENIRCRMVLYADHGNILIGKGTDIEEIEKTKYTFHEDLIQIPLGIRSREKGTGADDSLISIGEINMIIIGLMKKENILFESRDYVKVMRSEIYNPDFKFLYKKVHHERGLLAFEAFIFQAGYKLAVYADGVTELYSADTDREIEDMQIKMRLLDKVKSEITVCGLNELK